MAMTKSDTLNYRGELFLVGQNQTPFTRAIAANAKRSSSFIFSMGQTYSLASASQPAITEDAAAAAGTADTYTRAEVTNTAQIFKRDVSVSFMKQSQSGQMSGINNGQDGVMDQYEFQKAAILRQIAVDLEYTFLQGTYAAAANTSTAAKTRGIITGTTTNAVAASSATLTKDMVDSMLQAQFSSGSTFNNSILFVNAFQKRKLSSLYGYAPMDRNVGGLNIQQIETDFGLFGIVLDPFMPTDTVLCADVSYCAPVFVPVQFNADMSMQSGSMDGIDVAFYDIGTVAAARSGFWYSQIGLDYGPEKMHGKITGLATA